MDNFKCKAEKCKYCNQWLRPCVGWESCNLKDYGAPCPGCIASSPLDNERYKNCVHKTWKKQNYIE